MAYLISAHVFREKPSVTQLAELPNSIGYRLYFHGTANLYLLDVFRASKVPQYPFQTLLPTVDIPLDLPPALDVLRRLFEQLGTVKLANPFKRSYINGALLLSRLVQLPVFSFVSDDDELDFTCSASDGALRRLKCRCGDLLISYDGTQVQIAPMVPEAEADEDLGTDTAALKTALPDVQVLPREAPWNTQLHALALEELRAFAGVKDAILGLGSFDPPEDEAAWQLVASRSAGPAAAPETARKREPAKRWWEMWK